MKTRFLGQVAAVLLCFSLLTHAAFASNAVDLVESSNGSDGTYILTNNSTSSIQAFAVSNNTSGLVLSSSMGGWYGTSFSKASWDSSTWHRTYGSFESLFGTTTDHFVNFYFNYTFGNVITSGATSGTFGFQGPAASEYVAWDSHGDVIYQSFAAQVPEPESYAMLIAGLGLLGTVARRRKNKQA